MEESIEKAIRQLVNDYSEVDNKSYSDYYLILMKLRNLVGIIGRDKYNDAFLHIYNATDILTKHEPGREDDEDTIPLIKRELDYLVHNLSIK